MILKFSPFLFDLYFFWHFSNCIKPFLPIPTFWPLLLFHHSKNFNFLSFEKAHCANWPNLCKLFSFQKAKNGKHCCGAWTGSWKLGKWLYHGNRRANWAIWCNAWKNTTTICSPGLPKKPPHQKDTWKILTKTRNITAYIGVARTVPRRPSFRRGVSLWTF